MTASTSLLQERGRDGFRHTFGSAPAWMALAPGRVNLIGEHTDYNDGFVLPCALPFQTIVAAGPRTDRQVRVRALDLGDALDTFSLDQPPQPLGQGDWRDYVRGMLLALDATLALPHGLDLTIAGDVPHGAGLSSSASLMVALGTLVRALFGHPPDPVGVAQLARLAENQFVGCQCGIMDQLASACGAADHAVLLDCRDLAVRLVRLPPDCQLMILHSRVRRGLVDSAYNQRRQQCEQAARHFGVRALRDVSEQQIADARPLLDPVVWRRARHVVSENARVWQAADALPVGDLTRMASLMSASHQSMRDDFEITVPAIDQLVAIVTAVLASQGGARMTGGGFGGCVVALVPTDAVPAVTAAVARHYRSPEGANAQVHVCTAASGARAVALEAAEPEPTDANPAPRSPS